MTDAGRHVLSAAGDNAWRIKVCELTFVSVTGVAYRKDGTAIVEYAWKVDKVTPLLGALWSFRCFGQEDIIAFSLSDQPAFEGGWKSVCEADSIQEVFTEEVVMRKYDDGWRFTK